MPKQTEIISDNDYLIDDPIRNTMKKAAFGMVWRISK